MERGGEREDEGADLEVAAAVDIVGLGRLGGTVFSDNQKAIR